MVILVISDSHGDISALDKINVEQFDSIIHLGDFVRDCENIKDKYNKKIDFVRGNCDHGSQEPEESILEILGKKILITHGHKYNVKYGISKLYYRALELEVDMVMFGHTHVPFDETYDEIRFINPGSLSIGRGKYKKSCFILELGKEIVGYLKEIK